ncbi:MAG: hypothetical protein ACRC80_08610 [Waterburya sp.]
MWKRNPKTLRLQWEGEEFNDNTLSTEEKKEIRKGIRKFTEMGLRPCEIIEAMDLLNYFEKTYCYHLIAEVKSNMKAKNGKKKQV